jgi:hypothetical protein
MLTMYTLALAVRADGSYLLGLACLYYQHPRCARCLSLPVGRVSLCTLSTVIFPFSTEACNSGKSLRNLRRCWVVLGVRLEGARE